MMVLVKLGGTHCGVSTGNGSDPHCGSRGQKCCSGHSLCEQVHLFICALHMHAYIFILGFLDQTESNLSGQERIISWQSLQDTHQKMLLSYLFSETSNLCVANRYCL